MFSDLPDGCVALVAEHLQSVQDVLTFQRTCSRFATIGRAHQAIWLSLLHRDFDIRLEVLKCSYFKCFFVVRGII